MPQKEVLSRTGSSLLRTCTNVSSGTTTWRAYEEATRTTASKPAPWFVVPADNRWSTRLVVATAIVEAVEQFDLTYPKVDAEEKKELATMRAALAHKTRALRC